jgi:hypothetical protein
MLEGQPFGFQLDAVSLSACLNEGAAMLILKSDQELLKGLGIGAASMRRGDAVQDQRRDGSPGVLMSLPISSLNDDIRQRDIPTLLAGHSRNEGPDG